MAAMSLSTLQALFRAPTTTKTTLHASRAVTDVISNCLLAGVRGGPASVDLAARTAALITMSRYATLQDRNNTPDQPDQDQCQDYKDKDKIKTKAGAVLNHSPASACSFDVACGC